MFLNNEKVKFMAGTHHILQISNFPLARSKMMSNATSNKHLVQQQYCSIAITLPCLLNISGNLLLLMLLMMMTNGGRQKQKGTSQIYVWMRWVLHLCIQTVELVQFESVSVYQVVKLNLNTITKLYSVFILVGQDCYTTQLQAHHLFTVLGVMATTLRMK